MQIPKYFFNSEGLRFSVYYLSMMKAYVKNIPVNIQAELVDMQTYESVLHKRNVRMKFSENLTPTQIGNLAFVFLYHPKKEQRKIAKEILDKL